MSLEIEGATLTLLDKTPGFHDLLSPVGLDATLHAPLAPEEANRWRRGVSQFATNALGKSMWVDGTPLPGLETASRADAARPTT
jgi:hypothetical protein